MAAERCPRVISWGCSSSFPPHQWSEAPKCKGRGSVHLPAQPVLAAAQDSSHRDRRALENAAQWRSASLPCPIIPLNKQCATGKRMKGREEAWLKSLNHENRRFITVVLHSSTNTLHKKWGYSQQCSLQQRIWEWGRAQERTFRNYP